MMTTLRPCAPTPRIAVTMELPEASHNLQSSPCRQEVTVLSQTTPSYFQNVGHFQNKNTDGDLLSTSDRTLGFPTDEIHETTLGTGPFAFDYCSDPESSYQPPEAFCLDFGFLGALEQRAAVRPFAEIHSDEAYGMDDSRMSEKRCLGSTSAQCEIHHSFVILLFFDVCVDPKVGNCFGILRSWRKQTSPECRRLRFPL